MATAVLATAAARRRVNWRDLMLFVLLLAPNVLFLATFVYWSLLFQAYLSLTAWDMLAPEKLFVGLDNYVFLAGVTSGVAGKFQFGTAFLPEKKQFGCCTGGSGLGIMQSISAEKKTATFNFVKFASLPEQQVSRSQATGSMPVCKSSVNNPDMKAYFEKNPNAKVAVDQLSKTQPQDAARVFIRNGDQIIGKGLEKIMLEKQDAKTAFTATAEELTREASKPGGVLQLVKQRKP